MRSIRVIPLRAAFVAFGALVLAGCATFSQDGGFGAVEATAQERLGTNAKIVRASKDGNSVDLFIRERLNAPLSVDDAVQVALLSNRGLQSTYEELGIAEADLVQAGRLTNPHFAYLNVRNSESKSIEWALTFPIIDLLTMPLRRTIEAHRFEQTKLEVSSRVLDVAFETRRAYFQAVAATEMVRYLEQ
ncbi:MAG: TolC family protein, partial [Burkholderiales bacterium]